MVSESYETPAHIESGPSHIFSRISLIPLSGLMLFLAVMWRNLDVFVLGLDKMWTNIMPSKLFPLLILLGLFWKYRNEEFGSVLGLRSINLKSHLILGAIVGVTLYLLGDFFAAILYATFFDPSLSLDIIILNADLLWYSAIFFLVNGIYEEALFRGLLQNGLRTHFSVNKALLLSASIFGIYHLIWPIQTFVMEGVFPFTRAMIMVIFSGLLGLTFGIYYERFDSRRSLAGPIAAHTILNVLNENIKISSAEIVPGPDVLLVNPIQMAIALILVSIAFITIITIGWKFRFEHVQLTWSRLKDMPSRFLSHMNNARSQS
jgi:membrane protease YdiL (CAAX protease family)